MEEVYELKPYKTVDGEYCTEVLDIIGVNGSDISETTK